MPIRIYTAPHCKYSLVAKKFFDDRGLAYEECSALEEKHYADLVAKTGQASVPVVEIGSHIFVGFNRKGFEKALARRA